MKGAVHKRLPPWKQPWYMVWFVAALCVAGWLTLHMPATHSARLAYSTQRPANEQSVQSSSAPLTSLHKVENPAVEVAPQSAKKQPPRSDLAKLFAKTKTFGALFLFVGTAAFVGGVIEARRWHMVLARSMGKLTNAARLPAVVGLAMPTALCSNAAANGILVNSYTEGNIRTSALIAGGMANSYLAYVSHSIRVMYPVIGAIGLPGALYFIVQFSGGLLVIFAVMLWNRWYIGKNSASVSTITPEDPPCSWPATIQRAGIRTLSLLFRMVCITLPLMIGIEWLLKGGYFNFWEHLVPEQISRFFPAELVSVAISQLGGLVQSSSVAANLRAEGLIHDAQILLAMLVGSAVGNPFRTLRRNLPTALSIFPARIACTIVFGMQFARLVTTFLAIGGVVAYMHYVLYQ